LISVLIPVKNGGAELARCLDAIQRQRLDAELEVVVVDSGSTDGSIAAATSRGARVRVIPPESFRHGSARNLAADEARGDILVFTTQDAVAADDDWLRTLVAPLADRSVAGVYGRQLPHADASPPEQYFLEFLYGPVSRVQRIRDLSELTFETTLFSNVNSAMLRSTWEQHRFRDDLIMSEDQEWSRRVLLDGYAIAYEARAAVRHSHSYSIADAFRRFFDSGVSAASSYVAEGASRAALRRAFVRYARGEVRWLVASGQRRWLPYVATYELSKLVGLQMGLRHERVPLALKRRLSSYPAYWTRDAAPH
jgi:rhamnosyltransferase